MKPQSSIKDAGSDAIEALRYSEARQELEKRGLSHFLRWLCQPRRFGERTVCLAASLGAPDPDDLNLWVENADGDWVPMGETYAPIEDPEIVAEKLFAAYFGVDLDAVERHRVRLLEKLQEDARG
ncbi:MAG: hypothetical protein K0U16_07630 [Gammaproteobacteria bacterium]|nr:hypothetical protein [Gammaproteobacteria bacterium]